MRKTAKYKEGKIMCEKCMGYFSHMRLIKLQGEMYACCNKCATKYLLIEKALKDSLTSTVKVKP